jgi:hypothetical protein
MVDAVKADVRIGQLAQNAVSASGIAQQEFVSKIDGKAGVIATGSVGVACPQHNQTIHHFSP